MIRTRAGLFADLILAAASFTFLSCGGHKAGVASPSPNRVVTQSSGAQSSQPVSEDGQWTMPAKDYASTRFSGLNEINKANVGALKLAWSFSTGVIRGNEAASVVAANNRE